MKRLLTALLISSSILMAPLWISLALKWPVTDDPIFYATILKLFSAEFWHGGQWYPRWLTQANDGLGSPVFLFYSPIAFYISSAFEWLASFDPHGFIRLVLCLQLALIASGFTCYRWLKLHMDEEKAVRGALLYASFPYMLVVIYYYFGMSQLWAIALFPLLLEASDGVVRSGWRGLVKLSVMYALLCMTHLPSLLLFSFIPPLYILMQRRSFSTVVIIICAALLSIGLSAIYLLPMFANKPFIISSHYLDGKLFYANNFEFWPTLFSVAIILLPLLELYIDLPPVRRELSRNVRFWLAIMALLLFMTTSLSMFLWDWITPLQYLQFPSRFFIAMLPGVVFIASGWMPYAKHNIYKWITGFTWLISAIFTFLMFQSTLPPIIGNMIDINLITQAEYWAPSFKNNSTSDRWSLPPEYQHVKPIDLTQGSAEVTIASEDARHIILHADIKTPMATVILKRLYFPGWVADKSGVIIHDERALLAVTMSRGKQDIILSVPAYAGEQEGARITLIAALSLFLLLPFSYRKQKA